MTGRLVRSVVCPSGLAAQLSIALLSGALGVLAFAPFYFWPLGLVSLLVLFMLWQRSATKWRAFSCGFAWGLGLFSAGVSWIYVSLHFYGHMPAILAGLATLLFCCYLALYPALAGVMYRMLATRLALSPTVALLVLMPACFVVFEYLRGWVVSGFPWLTMGYTQTPGGFVAGPLAGYAAIIGVFGISWLLALTVAVGLVLARGVSGAVLSRSARVVASLILLLVWGAGSLLTSYDWTVASGKALRIALLQGNVDQDMKWRDDQRVPTLANYHQLVTGSQAKLIVMPETALPDLLDRIPADYIESLRQHALRSGADVLLGAPVVDRPGGADAPYHLANSAISVGASPTQRYDKRHLVAFGEFIPPMFSWVYRWLKMPLADFSPPTGEPRPMQIGGHQIAVNICYEDAFGAEIAAQLPDAELLVNMSNMAWFGRSLAPGQHAQLSQMRAMETGRWMLRATNTGATAAINEKGVIVRELPIFTRGVLEVEAQPMKGATPYSRWRDTPTLVILALCLLSTLALRNRIKPGLPG